jgi:hypothetical protein
MPRIDVYGSRPGKAQMQKMRSFFSNDNASKLPPHILLAKDGDHTRHRRLLAHAFSDLSAARAGGHPEHLLPAANPEAEGGDK